MINIKEDLVVSKAAPKVSEVKKKSLFFCKGSDPLDENNVRSTCQCGDFTGNPLEHLLSITQEVYFPLVTTVENQDGWPEVISKEVTENMHKFLASLYITMGSTKGRTLLPMPPANGPHEHEVEALAHDKEQVHVLENAVVTWTKQIKNVLKMDSETLLKSGKHPGPRVELDFWKGKSENLNAIHEQLSSEKIKKVMRVLELTKSTYFPAFNRLCKEVAQARMEANDNVTYLKPLERFVNSLGNEAFPELVPLFQPMLHTVLLIWRNSKFYNTPARLVVLVREICNDIIKQACRFINGTTLFTMEPHMLWTV